MARMFRMMSSVGVALAVAVPVLAADTPAKPVTFSKDVAPIFQEKCQECHQPNSIAPMSLITFQEARPWARSIKERVRDAADAAVAHRPSVGVQKFKNDMSLTDEQIDTIVRWVDGGALQGDPKDLPPPKPLVTDNEWQGVTRRLRPARPRRQVVRVHDAGRSTRTSGTGRCSDIPLTEPRWVKMVEIRPTNLKARKIIHHSIAYLVLNNDPDAVNTGHGERPEPRRRAPTTSSTAARS